jgi:hypothetical protein
MGCRCPEPPRPVEIIKTITAHPLSCIAKELIRIDQLQKEAILEESCLSCSGSRLGDNVLGEMYNTRPFILYLESGEEFSIRITDPSFFTSNSDGGGFVKDSNYESKGSSNVNCWWPYYRSSIFRVEDVDKDCARLRALKYSYGKLVATCFCVTVDLSRFVGIQCFSDVFISNLACPD